MKLKSLNKFIGFLILSLLFFPLKAEEQIDIWKKEKKKEIEQKKIENNNNNTIFNTKILNSKNKI